MSIQINDTIGDKNGCKLAFLGDFVEWAIRIVYRFNKKKPKSIINISHIKILLGTIAAESAFKYRREFKEGPGRGVGMMKPSTAIDIFENFLKYDLGKYHILTGLWLNIITVPYFCPTRPEVEWHLEHDDRIAMSMTYLHLLRYNKGSHRIPDDLDGQAGYWKRFYNTVKGAGTVEHYKKMWQATNLQALFDLLDKSQPCQVSNFLEEVTENGSIFNLRSNPEVVAFLRKRK